MTLQDAPEPVVWLALAAPLLLALAIAIWNVRVEPFRDQRDAIDHDQRIQREEPWPDGPPGSDDRDWTNESPATRQRPGDVTRNRRCLS